MPDHWGYVLTAYAVAALALGGYWRHLARRARALAHRQAGARRRSP
jgi:cytochrome oxidase assembly protein ShyY1